MDGETLTERLKALCEERGVVTSRSTVSASVNVWRDGVLLAECKDLRAALNFVVQLYTLAERAQFDTINKK